MAIRVVRVARGVTYIKRVESRIALIHVLTAREETSHAQAVLKLFSIFSEEEEEFVSTRPLGFAAG